jgi:putative ABC transport system permease protein
MSGPWFQALPVRAAVALYRAILILYPPSFRARCAAPMLETFAEVCRRGLALGWWRFLRECGAEYLNALGGAWRSRFARERPAGRLAAPASGDGLARVVWLDVRYAVRRLLAAPGLLLFTTLTLGFAIAAGTAVFSVVDAVLLRPSPFVEADRLMRLMSVSAERGHTYPGLSREKLRQWRREADIFAAVEAYRPTTVVVTGGVEPEELAAAHVSPGLLATLGVPARHGRTFTAADAQPGAVAVVIVSEQYWRTRLGADPAAVGRTLHVNGRPHSIEGVMPERFHFPSVRESVWLPFDPEARAQAGEAVSQIIVRLAPGLDAGQARLRIAAAAERLEQERPLPTGWRIALVPGTLFGPDDRTRRTVWIIFGAVGLVLLTACANVANLLLSRAVERRREFAIRLVLGATRSRLIRELVVEGALIGAAAGAVGLLAARWALGTLVSLAPDALAHATTNSIAIDARVFTFGLALAIATGVLCNLPPAFKGMRSESHDALSGRNRTATATPVQRRFRAALVTGEIALAVVLLVGAALMVRSFIRLNAIDIGFDPDRLLAVTIGLDNARYGDERARIGFLRSVAADVAQLPGVTGVAAASGLPPTPGTSGLAVLSTDAGPCAVERTPIVSNFVSAGYFGLMHITLAAGRPLRDDDPPDAVVISATIDRLCGGSLVGRRLRLDDTAPPLQVVGVAADVKTRGLTAPDGELAVYMPFEADPAALPMVATQHERQVVPRRLLIRTDAPAAAVASIKRVLWAHDPDQPVLQAAPLADLMADSIRRERFMLTLMTLFSAVSLALASAGIFGVLAYTVAQRTNEIGIRLALGASAGAIVRLVVGHGLALAVLGVAAGVAGAYAVASVLAGLLYEVNPRDPAVFIVTPLLVLAVAVLASWAPTSRALRVDPASALRVD